jgi:hypothetical protein
MSKELFPQGDAEFAEAARKFVHSVGRDPDHFHLPADDFAKLVEAVNAFHAAITAHSNIYTKSLKTRMEKDATRAIAERRMRQAVNVIRFNCEVSDIAKSSILGIKLRPEKLRARRCPQTPPKLVFLGTKHGTIGNTGKHRIQFGHTDGGKASAAKPAGAERLELFVDLVPHDEKIPTWPGERLGGRRWYIGSFTRSPLTVEYPLTDQPMRVVYWGRWAAGNNDFGPDSATLVAKVEGSDPRVIRLPAPGSTARPAPQTVIITSGFRQLPELVEADAIDAGDEGEDQRLLTDGRAEAA